MNNIILRQATEEDYPKLCELAKADKYIKDFPAMSFRWGWKNKLRVATIEDKIVGFNYYNICVNRPWSNCYYIYSIPECRRMGIGTLLLNELVKDSKDKGREYIRWLVAKKNEVSYNFFTSQGYKPVREDNKHYIFETKLGNQRRLF